MQPPGERKGRTWHMTKKRRGEKSEVQKCSLYFHVSGEIGTLKYSDIYTPKKRRKYEKQQMLRK